MWMVVPSIWSPGWSAPSFDPLPPAGWGKDATTTATCRSSTSSPSPQACISSEVLSPVCKVPSHRLHPIPMVLLYFTRMWWLFVSLVAVSNPREPKGTCISSWFVIYLVATSCHFGSGQISFGCPFNQGSVASSPHSELCEFWIPHIILLLNVDVPNLNCWSFEFLHEISCCLRTSLTNELGAMSVPSLNCLQSEYSL